MPEIFRAFGWVFMIFPDDHDPPHVHVFGPGWQIKIALTDPPDLMLIAGRATRQEARKSLRMVRERLPDLLAAWEKIHG